ncbi:MAG: hypothetical protein WCU88_01255 [Elusimicrobiota bacterium]|jgi:hypothetical protein
MRRLTREDAVQDKIALLMEETGCDRAEAELALELCAYDLQSAVQAVPRLFQNILVLKGRIRADAQTLYGLWLVILNLKDRSLLRARAVVSCNPAVFTADLNAHWFDFEGRLYACRLWAGALPDFSQEVEHRLSEFFSSSEAVEFYSEKPKTGSAAVERLRSGFPARLAEAELQFRPELLDMGQFQEVRPNGHRSGEGPAGAPGPERASSGPLILRVALEPDGGGTPAGKIRAGDVVFTSITDSRDIAQYLAKLFGTHAGEGSTPLPVPVESVENGSDGVHLRVRFSAGLCGDAVCAQDERFKIRPKGGRSPWWRRLLP